MPAAIKDPKTGQFVSADASATAVIEHPEKPVELTDDVQKDLNDWTADAIGVKPEEMAGKKEPKAKKEPEKKEPAKAKVAPKAKAAPLESPPALTADVIAEATARGVRSAMQPAKDEKKDDDKDGPALTPKQQRQVSVLERMEQLQPETYKGASAKFKGNVAKLAEYAAQWEKDNAGQQFDDSADEHKEFFDKNDLFEFWDSDDYTEALADIRAEKRMEEQNKASNSRLSEFERREKVRESEPAILQEKNFAAHTFLTQLTDVLPEILGDDGNPDPAKVNQLAQTSPEAWQQFVNLGFETAELYKAMNGMEPLIDKEPPRMVNGAKNPRHDQYLAQQALGEFCSRQEQLLAAKPKDEQLDGDGRAFLTSADYYKRLKAEPTSTRDYYWRFSARDLTALRADELARKVKEIVSQKDAEHRKWAERHGIKLPDTLQERKQPVTAQHQEESDDDDGKPLSPGSGTQSRMAASKTKGVSSEKNGAEAWVDDAIGGR